MLVLVVSAAGLAWASTSGSPASAAPRAPAPEPAAAERFALTPTGADPSQPGSRTTFSFGLSAGATATDRVTLFNYADHATAFQLYANDARDTAEGQLDLKRADERPADAGAWVKLQQSAVVVAADHAVVVPFAVVVPAGASPGDHAAGIIASVRGSATTPAGQTVAVESRVGVPLYVRVAGPLHPALAVEGLASHYRRSALAVGGGSLSLTYRVVNVGNVRLAGHVRLTVTGPFGWMLDQRVARDVPELLPGASVAGTARFNGVAPAGRVTSTVRVFPFSKEGLLRPAPRPAQASSTVWAIPWLWILVGVALIGAVYAWTRRRRGRRGPPATGPASTDRRGSEAEPSLVSPSAGVAR